MKPLLLAMLLAICQALTPVPRKAADKTDRSGQQIKQNTSPKQTPSTSTATIPNIASPKGDQGKRDTPPKANTQETIFIPEPATVAITGKDWWDKAYVIFTGLLVGIGALGVCYAIKTLRAIERQAKANEDTLSEIKSSGMQTEQMLQHAGKQVQAVLLNAQVLRNTERPWILIYSEHVPGTKASALIAKNCGRTPARLVLNSKDIWRFRTASEILWELEKPSYGTIYPIEDPIIILPGEGTYILNITDWDVRRKCESEDRFKAVKDGSLELYIFGKLAYRDLLSADSDSFHETAWCCHYLADSGNAALSMFGLPGYTYHT